MFNIIIIDQFMWSDGEEEEDEEGLSNWAVSGRGRTGHQEVSDCVRQSAENSLWTAGDCNQPLSAVCEIGDFQPGRTTSKGWGHTVEYYIC